MAPAIARGNTVVIIPSEKYPLSATDFYQVLDTSDTPGGVVNIVTGDRDHLVKTLVQHEDVDAIWYFGPAEGSYYVEHESAANMKRTWVGYGLSLITGGWHTRGYVLASIANYLICFGRDISWRIRSGQRKMTEQARTISGKREPFHRCAVCAKTDISHPDLDFRYCPDCGGLGYCMEHINAHEHRKK